VHGKTVDVDDGVLSALGIHRLEIPVPFLEAGGPANVYVIEDSDGRYSLFDTGMGHAAGTAALREQAAARGLDLRKLSRILVSHGHMDHFGNAQMLSEESGARVFVHQADAHKVLGEATFASLLRRHRGYFLRLGVPPEIFEHMQHGADLTPSDTRYVEAHRLGELKGGDVFHFRHFTAVVKHMPGHTPGLVCLHAEGPQIFFADDHVLARVSPNPMLDLSQGEGPTKFRALSRYLEGARAAHQLDLKVVLPGHGPAFCGHRELLDGLFDFYQHRQGKLLARLNESPASIYELLPTLFPRRDVKRLVLMLSEALANIEVLEDLGKAAPVDSSAAIVRYAPTLKS
jgi:glyoxylase-like metal-dependent hydrolase (beta-lactamase superfamily II)